MPNTVNYVTAFETQLRQKYTRELLSVDLLTENVNFIGANIVKIPYVKVKGYKDHSRTNDFNRQTVENQFITKTLAHDRDIELKVDAMDVDETNQVLSAANLTNTFETEQAIPEQDVYAFSKLYADFINVAIGNKTADVTVLSALNILETIDSIQETMTNAEVPVDGRILYVTPTVNKFLKNALTRQLTATDGVVSRLITGLDNLKIKEIPAGRMKTVYDFSDGFVPGVAAKQINMICVHPTSVLYTKKHSYIHLWAPGSDSRAADSYLYQNRAYWDLFLLETRVDGVWFNITS
ncbi:MAG: capsid protein [Erysipelotrichaceae bacterium]